MEESLDELRSPNSDTIVGITVSMLGLVMIIIMASWYYCRRAQRSGAASAGSSSDAANAELGGEMRALGVLARQRAAMTMAGRDPRTGGRASSGEDDFLEEAPPPAYFPSPALARAPPGPGFGVGSAAANHTEEDLSLAIPYSRREPGLGLSAAEDPKR